MELKEAISQDRTKEAIVFRDLVERCQDKVFNTALVLVQDREDAEDIAQDVFLKVYEQLDGFREASSVDTWIYRITVNRSLDLLRKRKRLKSFGWVKKIFSPGDDEEPVHFEHPGVLLEKKEHAAVLFRALDKLPANQKAAFLLHKAEGLSHREIADIMRVSLMSVESLMVRAKNNLKKLLEQYYHKTYKR